MNRRQWIFLAICVCVTFYAAGYTVGVSHEAETSQRAILTLERCVGAADRANDVLRNLDVALTSHGSGGAVGP